MAADMQDPALLPVVTGGGRGMGAVDIEAPVDGPMARFGRIDAVVDHTGHPPAGDLVDILDEGLQRGDAMMVPSVVRMARLVTTILLAQSKGTRRDITTFAACAATLRFPVSFADGAALGAFTTLHADRYAADGIRMNALLPRHIGGLDHKPETAGTISMRRIGAAAGIARTAAFLPSDDAGRITGQNVRGDGGITRHV